MSCLPHFLLPYRHYLVWVVMAILVAWLEQGGSWSELVAAYGADGTPGRRTMQRWVKAFEAAAPHWLRALWRQMAQQEPGNPWLEPRGPTIMAQQGRSAGQTLLSAAEDWLKWMQPRRPELARLTSDDRLAFLGMWGSSRGPGRWV